MRTAECRTPPSSIALRRLPLDDGLAVLLGGDKSPAVANIARPQCPLEEEEFLKTLCYVTLPLEEGVPAGGGSCMYTAECRTPPSQRFACATSSSRGGAF